VRQLYAEGKVGRDRLLDGEGSYHGPGTCTFYGTANSNQMLMEVDGPAHAGRCLRQSRHAAARGADRAAAQRAAEITALGNDYTPIGRDRRRARHRQCHRRLMATGGSTNHTIHLIAMAAAAGIRSTGGRFADMSTGTPLLARVYPNGKPT
jgi:phosphogluconate dehydratase